MTFNTTRLSLLLCASFFSLQSSDVIIHYPMLKDLENSNVQQIGDYTYLFSALTAYSPKARKINIRHFTSIQKGEGTFPLSVNSRGTKDLRTGEITTSHDNQEYSDQEIVVAIKNDIVRCIEECEKKIE